MSRMSELAAERSMISDDVKEVLDHLYAEGDIDENVREVILRAVAGYIRIGI